jgi:hypothetical protein
MLAGDGRLAGMNTPYYTGCGEAARQGRLSERKPAVDGAPEFPVLVACNRFSLEARTSFGSVLILDFPDHKLHIAREPVEKNLVLLDA